MAVTELNVFLLAHPPSGKVNDRDDFLAILDVSIEPYNPRQSSSEAPVHGLEIGFFTIEEFKQWDTERYEHFSAAIEQCLASFAAWLAKVPSENVERLRASGFHVFVLITMWMDQDQMDFDLPPALSLQLGRLGLELRMLSNE